MIPHLKDAKTKEDVLGFLSNWLTEQLELSRREQVKDTFDKPAWAEYQAYQLGIQKLATKLLQLLPDPEK